MERRALEFLRSVVKNKQLVAFTDSESLILSDVKTGDRPARLPLHANIYLIFAFRGCYFSLSLSLFSLPTTESLEQARWVRKGRFRKTNCQKGKFSSVTLYVIRYFLYADLLRSETVIALQVWSISVNGLIKKIQRSWTCFKSFIHPVIRLWSEA